MLNWLLHTDSDFGKTLQRIVFTTVFLALGIGVTMAVAIGRYPIDRLLSR